MVRDKIANSQPVTPGCSSSSRQSRSRVMIQPFHSLVPLWHVLSRLPLLPNVITITRLHVHIMCLHDISVLLGTCAAEHFAAIMDAATLLLTGIAKDALCGHLLGGWLCRWAHLAWTRLKGAIETAFSTFLEEAMGAIRCVAEHISHVLHSTERPFLIK